MSYDSILINVPVSSPLHPQANLSFLKGFIKQNGYKCKIYIPGQFISKLYTYFTASSTEWVMNPYMEKFIPNFYIDISDKIEQKIAAIKCYKSECREYPRPRSLEALRHYSEYFGISVGMKNAKPFCLVRDLCGKI